MEIWLVFLFVLVICSLSLTALLVWLLVRTQTRMAETTIRVAESMAAQTAAVISLLDKSVRLLSVKDPMSYQAVSVMDTVGQYTERYDPSDEAEEDRLRAFGRKPEEGDLNGEDDAEHERRFYDSIGVPE